MTFLRDQHLRDYQRDGVAWLAERRHGCLADDMGLGKTVTALRAAEAVGAARVLIVCPAVVTFNWLAEAQKWFLEPWEHGQVIDHSETPVDPDARVVIISSSMFHRVRPFYALRRSQWPVLIVDEAHDFRNHSATRTQAMFGLDGRNCLTDRADRVWLLTGTPMPNDPSDLWAMLYSLAPETIENEHAGTPMARTTFLSRYCVMAPCRYRKRKVIGAQRLPELRQRTSSFFLRRKKTDHLDLPPVRFDTVRLRAPLDGELRAMDRAARGQFGVALEGGDDVLDQLEKDTELAEFAKLCGMAKAPATADLLAAELEVGALDCVVVFAHHVAVLDVLAERLKDYGVERIDGSVSNRSRTAAVERFQAGGPRVMLGNIRAAGVGITLTRASEVVMVELSWVPGENAQAVDRINRMGQTASALRCRFMSLAGTLDEAVMRSLQRKTDMIRGVMN